MNDKELLELAAKAAGGLVYVDGMGWIHEDENGNRGAWSNPLKNDGDALRLAVTLATKYGVFPLLIQGSGFSSTQDIYGMPIVEGTTADLYNATRRAIVRAAAEIGKSL